MDKEIEPTKMETKEVTFVDRLESEDEDISESFICCVCLDLLYKPIVLACGHVSCFWCVHMSMNGLGRSSCPICRHSYQHFPSICELLHFLIVKLYPNAYHRRDNQMLEKEKKMDSFSPQFDLSSLKSNRIGGSACSSVTSIKSSSTIKVSELEKPMCLQDVSMSATEENKQSHTNCSGTSNQISITDVLCLTCKKLLFRPIVLNCGHAYCETCIIIPADEIILCSICESLHPSDYPKVCLDLNNFLEKTFPEDYVARRDFIERQRDELQQKPPIASSSKKKSDSKDAYASSGPTGGDLLHWLTEHGPKVHIGAGCDYCGVYPIVGTRYRCKDCKEKVGFDLCEKCYNTQSKLPGRFNQQHTAEHRFEVLKTSEQARGLMLRLVTGSFDHAPLDASYNASEESEDESVTMDFVINPPPDNNEDGSAEEPNNHSMGDQNNDI